MATSGGRLGWLCDQPVSVLCGFVLSMLIDTDGKKRDWFNAKLDNMNFVENEDGTYDVVPKPTKEDIGFEIEGVEVPEWFSMGTGIDLPDLENPVSGSYTLEDINVN